MSEVVRLGEVALWLTLFAMVTPAMWRLLLGRARGLDRLWAAMWFGTLNRVAFNGVTVYLPGNQLARDLCHLQAVFVCAWVLIVVYRIQRADRARG